jgi:hypothetical protein
VKSQILGHLINTQSPIQVEPNGIALDYCPTVAPHFPQRLELSRVTGNLGSLYGLNLPDNTVYFVASPREVPTTQFAKQIETIPRSTLGANPCPASILIIKAISVLPFTYRAGTMPVS